MVDEELDINIKVQAAARQWEGPTRTLMALKECTKLR
jgi:hypothetical protein